MLRNTATLRSSVAKLVQASEANQGDETCKSQRKSVEFRLCVLFFALLCFLEDCISVPQAANTCFDMPKRSASRTLLEPQQPKGMPLPLSYMCEISMGKTINPSTATHYYHVACEYGLEHLRRIVLKWFLVNLTDPSIGQLQLRGIPIDLMTELVASPDLYVWRGERQLYDLLCLWMYMRIHPGSEPGDLLARTTPSRYFGECFALRGSFLATAAGQPYVEVFRNLRTQYLCGSDRRVKELDDGRVLPEKWIAGHLLNSWLETVLGSDDDAENVSQDTLTPGIFLKRSNRLGICLPQAVEGWWRWPRVTTGMDILGTVENRRLKIRFEYAAKPEGFMEHYQRQQILIRGLVTAVKEGLQLGNSRRSPILQLSPSLERGEEVTVMELDEQLPYPLKVSFNILIGVPLNERFKDAAVPLTQ